RIPVVIITAQKDPAFDKHVTELGAVALITKPFQPRKLGDLLRRVLAGQQAEPSTPAH
ncbi:MAG: DNA-binding response regulator, partial [Gemmatimonadales bacterium]|nr:DNA-binding response regulator [Gemmatimonadales bacterium]